MEQKRECQWQWRLHTRGLLLLMFKDSEGDETFNFLQSGEFRCQSLLHVEPDRKNIRRLEGNEMSRFEMLF